MAMADARGENDNVFIIIHLRWSYPCSQEPYSLLIHVFRTLKRILATGTLSTSDLQQRSTTLQQQAMGTPEQLLTLHFTSAGHKQVTTMRS